MDKKAEQILVLDPSALSIMGKDRQGNDLDKGDPEAPRMNSTLEGILKSLKGFESTQLNRISFESDPLNVTNSYGSLYRLKNHLVPDHIIKKVIGPQGDDLLCAILQARSNMVASFGRPRTSRFAVGFEFQEIDPNKDKQMSPQDHEAEKERIRQLKEVLWNCGSKEVDDEYFAPNLSQFLKQITRDGLGYGRFAVEFLSKMDFRTGKKKLYAWRPVDAGTIFTIIPHKEMDQSTRAIGMKLMAELKGKEFDPRKFKKDQYKYVQVIDGRPVQAFTEEELIVYNLYPVTNVEYNGYPLTPIDQTLNAIVTHINICLHNRLYFQNGRAARGMMILNSDEADESVVQKIRLQFHQSINAVQNSWRMPVFKIDKEDKLEWQPIDVSGRDAEFQYLSDSNARVILSAFQMSPEELPGYAHLSRGTNSQALSESDNEWKLTAARDVGLRPLVYDVQDFLNSHILPKLDPEISKKYQLVLAGLEKDSPEKEATRLTQDMPIHMTYNEVLQKVEKKKLPKKMGGEFPFNPQYQQVIQAYLTSGQIMEYFFGIEGAAQDPREDFKRDPMWLQWQQILLQKAQLSAQISMAAQQPAPPPQDESFPPDASPAQKAEIQQRNLAKRKEWEDATFASLSKAADHNRDKLSEMILARHKEIVGANMKKFRQESERAVDEMLAAVIKKG